MKSTTCQSMKYQQATIANSLSFSNVSAEDCRNLSHEGDIDEDFIISFSVLRVDSQRCRDGTDQIANELILHDESFEHSTKDK